MRELLPLTPDVVGELVGGCAPCTFWQTVPRNGHSDAGDPLDVLAEWVETVTADWGPPGRIAYVDGTPAGHVVLAPALDVAFLEKVGFRVERDHPAYPRLRIDLRTVVTLRDGAAAAIVRALDRVPGVRPVPETHPNGSSHAHVTDRR